MLFSREGEALFSTSPPLSRAQSGIFAISFSSDPLTINSGNILFKYASFTFFIFYFFLFMSTWYAYRERILYDGSPRIAITTTVKYNVKKKNIKIKTKQTRKSIGYCSRTWAGMTYTNNEFLSRVRLESYLSVFPWVLSTVFLRLATYKVGTLTSLIRYRIRTNRWVFVPSHVWF